MKNTYNARVFSTSMQMRDDEDRRHEEQPTLHELDHSFLCFIKYKINVSICFLPKKKKKNVSICLRSSVVVCVSVRKLKVLNHLHTVN